jgi:dienelactone hydrolase
MKRFLLSVACVLSLSGASHAMTPEERKQYLDKFMQTLPSVPGFTQWQQTTGELPPDFDALPKTNSLPDPLTFLDGRPVKTPADWKARRAEIIQLFEKYDIGTLPPKPTLDSVTPVDAATAARDNAARGGGRGFGGPAPVAATGPAATGPAATAPAAFGRAGGRGFGRGGPPPAPGTITRIVDLHYGPQSQITTRVTLNIPPGNGPFPVLIAGTPDITSRGYISCSFPGSVDMPPDVGKYYPDATWGSMAKMAWVNQMVVDYLETVPEVDKAHIAITGYSRNGKMALITTALDERIGAVVAGSTGVGGVYAWRDGSERNSSESIESTTRSFPIWFTTSLRFFSGREDRLPVDGNLLVALVAPRSCLVLWGDNDEVSQSWGMEHSVKSGATAYAFVGRPDAVGTMHIPGYHGANDLNRTFEWLDIQFGRSTAKWTNDIVFPWNYDQWHAQVKTAVSVPGPAAKSALDGVTTLADWDKKKPDITDAVTTMLGVNTPGTLAKPFPLPKLNDPSQPATAGGRGGFPGPGGGRGGLVGRGGAPDAANPAATAPAEVGVVGPVAVSPTRTLSEDIRNKARGNSYGWLQPQAGNTTSRKLSFTGSAGNTIVADLYTSTSAPANTKLPVVIWEHGYSYSLGYSWVYKNDLHPILALTQAGYAVLAYDQSGFGSRISEAAGFYNKYPQWSQLGHMIADTQAAIDALSKDDQIDAQRLYLYGFSMGGNVALYTAALDPRVKGVVAISAFTPMRTDTADKGTGGIARLFRDKDLLPNLGIYEGHEASIPYDYDDLIAAIAPRPVYIVSPSLDRETTPADVHAAVERSRKVFGLYNASDKLVLDEPWDYSRLPNAIQDRAVDWMKQNMK